MEIKHRIHEFSSSPRYAILRAELDRLGVHYKVTSLGSANGSEWTSIEYIVGENDPIYPRVAELIHRHGFYVQTTLDYSEEDMSQAQWLFAFAGESQYPQPEDRYRETTYDVLNYCPLCGIGAVQKNPFRLKSDFKAKRSAFLGLYWVHDEIFVRPQVKTILEQARISDVEFVHPLHHRTGEPIEAVYQMQIKAQAAPGLVTDDLQTVTCMEHNEEGFQTRRPGLKAHGVSGVLDQYAYCGRVKYHHPRTTMITFTRDSLSHLPDIAKCSECFGSGGAAHHLILVSRRLADLIEGYRLRGLRLTPIAVV